MSHPLLFVYGTLLAVAEHPMGRLLQQNGRLLGEGFIRARLYMIDDPDAPGENRYPGALPSPAPSDRVYGEVHEIHAPDILFPAFDDFEACGPNWPEPHEFLRRQVDVTLTKGGVIAATSYLYTWDVSDAERLLSGRFKEVSTHVR